MTIINEFSPPPSPTLAVFDSCCGSCTWADCECCLTQQQNVKHAIHSILIWKFSSEGTEIVVSWIFISAESSSKFSPLALQGQTECRHPAVQTDCSIALYVSVDDLLFLLHNIRQELLFQALGIARLSYLQLNMQTTHLALFCHCNPHQNW